MHYSFHSTPTCTFKSRTETVSKFNQKSSIPGPADYKVQKPLHRTATVAQTTQKRDLYNKFEANPGPGSYQMKSYITDGVKRSISLRFLDYNKHTPGPQDYQNQIKQVLRKAPIHTMGNRSKSTHEIVTDHNAYKPGPTIYDKKSQFANKTHGIFVGTSKRKDLTETEKTPAPNQYNSQSAVNFAYSTNPRCKIGEENRKTDFAQGEETPGPAVYNKSSFVEENASKKKGYSCRQKVIDLIAQQLSRVPAPGSYEFNLKNKHTAPRCATTQTKRKTFMDDMQIAKQQYPGPGVHNPAFSGTKYRSTSANIFSKSNRKPLDENEKTPGPVEYTNEKMNVLNSAPKYSSGKAIPKHEFLSINPENPPPGSYDPKLTLVKPSTAISQVPREKRPNFDKQKYTPGPGFYNLRGKEEGPTWKFSTQKRISFTDQPNQAKNGTIYQLPSKVVDPPSYMNATSKSQFSPTKTGISR